jgi:predicted nucleic acid-binding Zn ribbon protein
MPAYAWKCASCDQVTDCFRAIADIEISPEQCDHCEEPKFEERVISRPEACKGYILMDTGMGWSSHGFYSAPYWPESKK